MIDKDILDPDDAELLQRSYEAIKRKDLLETVTDDHEWDKICQQTMDSMSLPPRGNFSFQHLFRMNLPRGHFYIAQCVIDFGFSTGRNVSSTTHEYKLQLIGIANLRIDLGKTMLRPETKLDKLIGRFLDHDIDLPGAERFNDKYYLVSDQRNSVENVFDKKFTEAIARHNNVLLSTLGNTMFIHFPEQLSVKQSATVEDIFSNCSFLES